jgi:hypothetical protein
MRRRFAQAGLPSPAFTVVCQVSREDTRGDFLPFDFPAVVKPVDNMGSRGCRRVDSSSELAAAVSEALKFSRSGRAIVEEYMEGPEFSVDAVVYRGEVTICGLADRHIFFLPYFIEMGHTMPSSLEKSSQDALIEVFIRGIKALGITDGAAKGDIKLTPRGPMIGEIAARLSGGYMSGWTYPYASGASPIRGAICAALGKKPQGLEPLRDWTSAERAFISIPGIAASLEGLEAAKNLPHIRDIFPRIGPGSRVCFPENNVSKGGNIISAAPDRETAIRAAEEAARSLLIPLDLPGPGQPRETEAFLASREPFPPPAFTVNREILDALEGLPPTKFGFKPPNMAVLPFPVFMNAPLADYMGRSPAESFEAVQKLTGLRRAGMSLSLETAQPGKRSPEESPFFGREFWAALIRGGYQGGAYYIEKILTEAGI